MKRFSFVMLAVAAAVCAVCWLGCGGGDNGNPADNSGNNNSNNSNNNGNNNSGDANHDGRLINAVNEVWVNGGCASGIGGYIFKSNGDAPQLRIRDDGTWKVDDRNMWRTNGDKLIIWKEGREEINYSYEVSNSTLTMIRIDWDTRNTYAKCGGLTIVGL